METTFNLFSHLLLKPFQPCGPPSLCVCARSCVALCNPMDSSPQGSSVHGIFQARTLERVVFPPPGALPDTGIKSVSPVSPLIGRGVLYHCTKWEDCGLLRQPPNSHKQVSPPPASFGISVTPPLFDPVICFTLLQRKKT